jgi:hypothetical protein
VGTGGGLAFWLDYVESRGGLWESAGDSTTVMIPPQIQARFELPEEFAVTAQPDVAREDGVALLTAGHPLLTAAAEDVLAADDAGVLALSAPPSQPPGDDRLLARARDAFPVEHGRIDAIGPTTRGLRQALRVGVLVTYAASADEVFHERAECWLDVPSRRELSGQAAQEIRRHLTGPAAPPAPPDLGAVPPAVAVAHRLLDERFSERSRAMADGSARASAEAELERARKYYAEALASLARRQASAAPDRQTLLAARVDAVRAEERRRLTEIEEKYTPQHEIRPYRLHLLLVPVLRLPVNVLRGTRRFPLELDWMLPAGAFAPVNCPGCGADTAASPLVAAKTGLGCVTCLTLPTAAPATRPTPPRAAAATAAEPAAAPPPDAAKPSVQATDATAGPARDRSSPSPPESPGRAREAGKTAGPAKTPAQRRPAAARPVPPAAKKKRPNAQAVRQAGEKLAMEFWSVTARGNLRALRRLCAADTPAAAAVRLYGVAGPAVAVGLAPGEVPQSLTSDSEVHGDGGLPGTGGYLSTGRGDYTYLLRWDVDTKLVSEVLPFGNWVTDRLPSARWLYGTASARMFGGLPEPATDLDPVAVRLWRKAVPTHGLPLALRCLAAWWRIGDGPVLLARHRPSVLAAATHRMIAYRAAEAGSTHDAIAGLYRVAPADTRAATPLLQARLQLTSGQPW